MWTYLALLAVAILAPKPAMLSSEDDVVMDFTPEVDLLELFVAKIGQHWTVGKYK
jgi:hypothetical protein